MVATRKPRPNGSGNTKPRFPKASIVNSNMSRKVSKSVGTENVTLKRKI